MSRSTPTGWAKAARPSTPDGTPRPYADSTMDEMKEELAKLVAEQAAEGVWTTPAIEEKLRIKALGTKLAKTGDPRRSFVIEQARRCKHIATAGDLASTLVSPACSPSQSRPRCSARWRASSRRSTRATVEDEFVLGLRDVAGAEHAATEAHVLADDAHLLAKVRAREGSDLAAARDEEAGRSPYSLADTSTVGRLQLGSRRPLRVSLAGLVVLNALVEATVRVVHGIRGLSRAARRTRRRGSSRRWLTTSAIVPRSGTADRLDVLSMLVATYCK